MFMRKYNSLIYLSRFYKCMFSHINKIYENLIEYIINKNTIIFTFFE